MDAIIAQGLADPAATGGAVALGVALVKLVEALIARRSGSVNGYAKADQVARLSEALHVHQGKSDELMALLLERQGTQVKLQQKANDTLGRIEVLLAERRECPGLTPIRELVGELRVENARRQA